MNHERPRASLWQALGIGGPESKVGPGTWNTSNFLRSRSEEHPSRRVDVHLKK